MLTNVLFTWYCYIVRNTYKHTYIVYCSCWLVVCSMCLCVVSHVCDVHLCGTLAITGWSAARYQWGPRHRQRQRKNCGPADRARQAGEILHLSAPTSSSSVNYNNYYHSSHWIILSYLFLLITRTKKLIMWFREENIILYLI